MVLRIGQPGGKLNNFRSGIFEMSGNAKANHIDASRGKCGFSSRSDSGPEIHKLPTPSSSADARSLTDRIRDVLQTGEVLNKDQGMKNGGGNTS